MTTFISLPGTAEQVLESSARAPSVITARSPAGTPSRARQQRRVPAQDRRDADRAGHADVTDVTADPVIRRLVLDNREPPRADAPDHVELGVRQQLLDPARPPGGRRHRPEPEPRIDLGAAGVVNPCDDLRHPDDGARDPRRDDVGVVPGCQRGERVAALDPGAQEHVAVEADPLHRRPRESRAEAREGLPVAVHHGHFLPSPRERERELRPHAAAAHDDDFHASSLRR
jgi:hypothetical protein